MARQRFDGRPCRSAAQGLVALLAAALAGCAPVTANHALPASGSPNETLRSEAGWYRGDFHTHTGHSRNIFCPSAENPQLPCPMARTLEAAASRGLDFIAITDHNVVALDEIASLQRGRRDLLLIPGAEVTTPRGHANLIGLSAPLQLAALKEARTDKDLLAEARRQGAIASLNHPGESAWPGHPDLPWSWPATPYADVTAVEVINGGSQINTVKAEGKFQGQIFWHGRLNAGHRLIGIAGSDNHDPTLAQHRHSAVGRPTTVVHAACLSVAGILGGIREGRVFIDVEGSRDRYLDYRLESGIKGTNMGGVVTQTHVGNSVLHGRVAGVTSGRIDVIAGGLIVASLPLKEEGRFRVDLPADRLVQARWVRIDVRSSTGDLLLVGNPIFVSGR